MVRNLASCLAIVAIILSALPWDSVAENRADDHSFDFTEAPHEPGSCHDSGAPCDDCGATCLCPCCPTVMFTVPACGLPVAVGLSTEHPPGCVDDLKPSDIVDRIFHPPRSS